MPPALDDAPTAADLDFQPLTPDRWDDLATLFGKQGAYSGCWCMWWRLAGPSYQESTSQERQASFHAVVNDGPVPGLLAYREGHPVGWCAIAPRSEFPRLARSRYWQTLDAAPVWSIVCFYISRQQRGQGVATRLLGAAVAHATAQGAQIIEAYPKEPADRLPIPRSTPAPPRCSARLASRKSPVATPCA